MNLNNLKSNNQMKLFSYDNFILEFVKLYNEKKLPNKIIFSGKKGTGKSTFAYHFINYILSKEEEFSYDLTKFEINPSNKSFNFILKNYHPNFYLINLLDEKKNIEISQIRKMYNYVYKSSFNNKDKIVLINNAESLSLNASNALLKIIEEPNSNVYFILIYDNSKSILDTIKSRCLKFNFFLPYDQSISTVNKIINDDIFNYVDKNLINHYFTVGDLINLINFSNTLKFDISKIDLKDFLISIIDKKYYKTNTYIKNYIFNYVDFYFLNLINLSKSKKNISTFYEKFIRKIYYLKKFNLDDESFFIDLKTNVLNG